MESIRELTQKIKQKIGIVIMFPPSDLLIIAVIVLVGFASFGLGRLSVQDTRKVPVTIVETKSQTASVGVLNNGKKDSMENVVASKNGTRYYLPWCSGARRIAKQNLITFSSIKEAKKAGYTKAANCKGLE
ncbi:MAG TPA: hypothetical protein ENI63_00215 [Candidatus Kaiserbacteria bacterium]|nr:hypothetical protein [Candidatus Kaiserbacteria bacterium]